MNLSLEPVAAEDFETLLALRITAMQPSLERLGRYTPERARERFAATFEASAMQHILRDGKRIGFITVKTLAQELHIDHLYLWPEMQGLGIGAWALNWAKGRASEEGRVLTLSALKLSDANRFYLRHGFAAVGEGEFDIHYRWNSSGV